MSPLGRACRAATSLVLVATLLGACGRTDVVRSGAQECTTPRPLATGTTEHRVQVDGVARRYLLHVPDGYDGTSRTPVVFLFHGFGSSPEAMLLSSRMARAADEQGFLVVAPEGSRDDTGRFANWDYLTPPDVDGSDLGYVEALARSIRQDACVDVARAYAAGFSNGAALTQALACDDTTGFAAYAAVSAPFTGDCAGARPASLLYVHGTADRIVPVDGGRTLIGQVPSVPDALDAWAAHDGCPTRPTRQRVTEHVERVDWRPCRDGSVVRYYEVAGGGHQWPGGVSTADGTRIDGFQTQEIDATALVTAFFAAHPGGRAD